MNNNHLDATRRRVAGALACGGLVLPWLPAPTRAAPCEREPGAEGLG
jgi:hypothetical protein